MLKTVGNPSTRYGNQTINDGNLIFGTSGKGVDFSATSQAAGMTSELLNDYEEGTWIPGVTFGGGSTGQTYSVQAGLYTKIGDTVILHGTINFSNKGSSSGNAALSGLPFSLASIDPFYTALGINISGLSSVLQAVLQASYPANRIELKVSGTDTTLTDLSFTNSTLLRFIFIYKV